MKRFRAFFSLLIVVVLMVGVMPTEVMAARKPKPEPTNEAPIIVLNSTRHTVDFTYSLPDDIFDITFQVEDENARKLQVIENSDSVTVERIAVSKTVSTYEVSAIEAQIEETLVVPVTFLDAISDTTVTLEFTKSGSTPVNEPPYIADGDEMPSVDGTWEKDGTIEVFPGAWSDDGIPEVGLTYSYEWVWDSGMDLGDVDNYQLTDLDRGESFSVIVTATDEGLLSSSEETSRYTVPVWSVSDGAPDMIEEPYVTGEMADGSTLTAHEGQWEDQDLPISYVFRWMDSNGEFNTGATYVLDKVKDSNRIFWIEVTATDDSDDFSTAVSDAYTVPDLNIPPIEIEEITYVALGDSIATGTTYGDIAMTPGPTKSYVTLFKEALEARPDSPTVHFKPYFEDGDRTGELLFKLQNNENMRTDIEAADIITISIGSNNLMRACVVDYDGYELDTPVDRSYDFYSYDVAVSEDGRRAFNTEWTQIMSIIRGLNAEAEVIVSNGFNPSNESDPLHDVVDVDLMGASENGADAVNTVIDNLQGTYDYEAFDDKAKLDEMADITYFYHKVFWGFVDARNPHPNQAGQDLIFTQFKTASTFLE